MGPSKKQKFNPKKDYHVISKRLILSIIVFLLILIASITAYRVILNSEYKIKNDISKLATRYYEDFLYQNLAHANQNNELIEKIKPYEKTGFATIYLRQLLYQFDIDQELIDYLTFYCDENKTSVKFYPTPPYTKNAFRTEYVYSCDF